MYRFAQGLVLGFAVLLLGGSAGAFELTSWGSETQVSTSECPSFCTNFDFDTDGGVQQASSYSSLADSKGSGQASVNLIPGAGLHVPELRAEAFSGGGIGRAQAVAFGMEGYTWDGTGSGLFSLNVALSGSVFDPMSTSGTRILAEVSVYQATDNFPFISDPGSLGEFGLSPLNTVFLSITETATNLSLSQPLNFQLNTAGDQVYLWARLIAEGREDGSFADAFSTLQMSFADETGLTSASVPEPTTALLLAAGMLACTAAARRAPRRRR